MHAAGATDTRTLGDVVAGAARRTSDGVLVACAALGVAGVAVIGLVWRPAWWLTPVMLALAAFGTWGIADRERTALGVRGLLFHVLRIVAALVGGAAAAFAAIMVFMVVIGGLIS
jgi:hypothetical protein